LFKCTSSYSFEVCPIAALADLGNLPSLVELNFTRLHPRQLRFIHLHPGMSMDGIFSHCTVYTPIYFLFSNTGLVSKALAWGFGLENNGVPGHTRKEVSLFKTEVSLEPDRSGWPIFQNNCVASCVACSDSTLSLRSIEVSLSLARCHDNFLFASSRAPCPKSRPRHFRWVELSHYKPPWGAYPNACDEVVRSDLNSLSPN